MPTDFKKAVQTRDGRRVRILCTDRNYTTPTGRSLPVLALVTSPCGNEDILSYDSGGRRHTYGPCGDDLVNEPETLVTFHNVYTTGSIQQGHANLALADAAGSSPRRKAILMVSYTPGRGATVEVVKEFSPEE